MPQMSYESIQKQIQKLQAQAKKLETSHHAKKVKSISQVRMLMKKLGVTVADLQLSGQKPQANDKPLTATKKRKSSKVRGPVAPKYRDPQTGESWTGRGKPPKWLAQHLSSGRQKDEFLIKAGVGEIQISQHPSD